MKTTTEDLGNLFDDFVEQLHDIVKNGEDAVVDGKVVKISAKPATLAVIRQLLKDNGIEARGTKASKLGDLANSLPFTSDDESDALPN